MSTSPGDRRPDWMARAACYGGSTTRISTSSSPTLAAAMVRWRDDGKTVLVTCVQAERRTLAVAAACLAERLHIPRRRGAATGSRAATGDEDERGGHGDASAAHRDHRHSVGATTPPPGVDLEEKVDGRRYACRFARFWTWNTGAVFGLCQVVGTLDALAESAVVVRGLKGRMTMVLRMAPWEPTAVGCGRSRVRRLDSHESVPFSILRTCTFSLTGRMRERRRRGARPTPMPCAILMTFSSELFDAPYV